MTTNEAGWDRAARLALGVVLLGLAAAGTAWPWGLLGIVPLATGLVGWCPLYSVFGMSTCAAAK